MSKKPAHPKNAVKRVAASEFLLAWFCCCFREDGQIPGFWGFGPPFLSGSSVGFYGEENRGPGKIASFFCSCDAAAAAAAAT